MSWISSTFDVGSGAAEEKMNGRDLPLSQQKLPQYTWVDIHEPQGKDDLCVNKKKVEEVQKWLEDAFAGRMGRAPVALLCGPSGSGKTATVNALAKSMGFSIREWLSPDKEILFWWIREGTYTAYHDSQLKQFEDFLFRASRYPSLMESSDTKRSVVLVEDIPNIFLGEHSTLLAATVRKYLKYGCSPMIIICNIKGQSNYPGQPKTNLDRWLFPDQLLQELNMTKISFNPPGKNPLKTALLNIILEERTNGSIKIPLHVCSKFLDPAIEMSNYDIRSAINQLQYLICGSQGPYKGTLRRTVQVPRKLLESLNSTTLRGRDEFHDIFRNAGRVLYCKKIKVEDKDGIPQERLKYDPEEIAGWVCSAPVTFSNLLNTNYLNVFTDMKMISEASDYITQTNVLLKRNRQNYEDIQNVLYQSILGFMKCSHADIVKTWLPLKDSNYYTALAEYEETLRQCRNYFPERMTNAKQFTNELLPYYNILNVSEKDEDKKKFVNSFSNWESSRIKFHKPSRAHLLRKKSCSSEDEEGPSTSGISNDSYSGYSVRCTRTILLDPDDGFKHNNV